MLLVPDTSPLTRRPCKAALDSAAPSTQPMNVLPPHPELLQSDLVILQNLHHDINKQRHPSKNRGSVPEETGGSGAGPEGASDEVTRQRLEALKDQPSVFCSWDLQDIPFVQGKGLIPDIFRAYVAWAQSIARHPTDVVFVTHLLLYTATSLPSALFLFYHFTWLHGIGHWILQLYYCGSFTLMLHNHIHNDGILARKHRWLDRLWPYVLEPLMGHTWDSYFYHHVKHHHVENNGPDDLSSTIRYQRDDPWHFCLYVGRFLALIWLELPLYFARKRRYGLAWRAAVSEVANYAFIAACARWQPRAALCALLLPLLGMRVGLMVGNFGQHALVDEADPASDFRSSVTLVDVPSNRYCFNDGWHTSHHLHPRRHWRDHPAAFLRDKAAYAGQRALVFQHIDYLMMTVRLLRKDYEYLAERIVPIGDQVYMSKRELADMLRMKTRRFTEDQIQDKFYGKRKART